MLDGTLFECWWVLNRQGIVSSVAGGGSILMGPPFCIFFFFSRAAFCNSVYVSRAASRLVLRADSVTLQERDGFGDKNERKFTPQSAGVHAKHSICMYLLTSKIV